MIRELAENPNVHQPLSAGRELVTDPDGRFAVYLGTGTGPHSATVQRVRLERRRGRVRRRGDPRAPPGARPQRRRVGARRVVHACRPGRAARGARDRPGRGRAGRDRDGARGGQPSSSEPPGASARRVDLGRRARHGAADPARGVRRRRRGGRARAGRGRLRQPRAATARRSSPSSTASPSPPGTPRTPRSACCSSAAPRSRPPGAAAPTGRSSPRGRARRRRAGTPVVVTHAGPDVAADPRAARIHGRWRGSTGCSTSSRRRLQRYSVRAARTCPRGR